MMSDEGTKLADLDTKVGQVEADFEKLADEEHSVLKLRKLIKKAQRKKIKILRKDLDLRRKYRVDIQGKHFRGNTRLEVKFARRRQKLVAKELKELSKLNAELQQLHQHTIHLDTSERALYESYRTFLQSIGLEAQALERAL